jgi:hypothetical protein
MVICMYDSDKKTNTQKLAETLKRCGLASSVTQAHQMAGDITSTEQKVQTFFDRKRQEMKNDLMKTVHPNREEFKSQKANDVVSSQIENYRQNNAKGMVDVAKNSEPLHIQVEFETPKTAGLSNVETYTSAANGQVLVEPEPKIEVFHDELPKSEPEHKLEVFHSDIIDNKEEANQEEIKPVEVLTANKEEIREKEDYINKYIEAPIEKEPESVALNTAPAAEKEEIKETKIEEVKPYTLPPQRPQSSMAMGPHPKTGQSQSVDIHSFFNFAKKGKV